MDLNTLHKRLQRSYWNIIIFSYKFLLSMTKKLGKNVYQVW